MKQIFKSNAIFLFLFLLGAQIAAQEPPLISRTFTESTALIANPERGWIIHRFTHDLGTLSNLRSSAQRVTLVLLKVDISAYAGSAHIGSAKITEVRSALQLCRTNGLKAFIRMAYAWDSVLAPDPADINTITNHILDFKQTFHDYKDVLVSIEMGMFGPWGECHSSNHSTVKTSFYYPVKTSALKAVHNAFIQALPEEKQIIVRRPYYIREIFNTESPLSDSEAYSLSPQSRTGYHNDAYLFSSDDGGTFAHGWSRAQELSYISQMTRHTFFGGEAFGTPNSTYNNYSNALQESEMQHMTYLHRDYQTNIYDAWGQWEKDNFTRRLGYRFVLNYIDYSQVTAPGGIFHLIITLHNAGFSSPHLSRPVELILKKGGTELKALVDCDPRQWNREEDLIVVDKKFRIPADIAPGSWQVLLNLPDKAPSLRNNPAYSIQIANNNIWTADTGYNILIESFSINPNAPGQRTQETSFHEISPDATPGPTPTPLRGDSNGDGIINIVDALMIAQYTVGLNPPNFNYNKADTNCSGIVDIIDALIVAQYVVGLVSQFC